MSMNISNQFFTLLQIADSIFPIGSYTQSNGLETYVQKGIVRDSESSKEYLRHMLTSSVKYNDGLAVKLAYEYAKARDVDKILELDELLTCSKAPREIKEGSMKLCTRFIKLINTIKRTKLIDLYEEAIKEEKAYGQYCISFGIFAAQCDISKEEALMAYVYNQASSIINNCTKLVPLGQLDGQKALFSMQEVMSNITQEILELTMNDIGRCSIGADIRAMQHEDLYSRLYMS
jgi:urease accessory protein